MSNIQGYIILNKKTSFITKLFIIISIMIFMTIFIIGNLKYTKYYQTIGQVIREEKEYKLVLYLNPYQLDIVKRNAKLTIDSLDYNYSIDYISDDYIISNDNSYYLKVILDINLKDKDKIINNTLQIKILESNKKIFYYIKDYFTKGENS